MRISCNSVLASRFRSFIAADSGAAAIYVTIAAPVFFGFASLAVDYSQVLAVQKALQASTDALAAAAQINGTNSTANVLAAATSYAGGNSGKNKLPLTTASMVTGYPTIKCLKSTGVSCSGTEGGNAVLVKQQASVDLYLAQMLGFKSTTITATSLAAKGGTSTPLNVMLVLDTTASMQSPDKKCSIVNASKLTCAMAGVRTILSQLDPSVDQVGLMVFPGLKSASQIGYQYCSPRGSIQPAPYSGSPVYQMIGLSKTPSAGQNPSTDFRTSNNSNSLNVNSNLVRAMGGDPSSCAGLQNPGGQGTYYADVIDLAQASLAANSRTGVQNIMIFLSDGDANSASVTSAKSKNECRQAISAAQAATAAGTQVYSIAYGAELVGCSTDSPAITPCATMKAIASDTAKFYSDAANGCTSSANPTTELVSIFKSIAQTFTTARLLDLNAT